MYLCLSGKIVFDIMYIILRYPRNIIVANGDVRQNLAILLLFWWLGFYVAYTTSQSKGLSPVYDLVHFQITSPTKTFTANITNKGFVTNMDLLVFFQVNSQSKCLTANITNKGCVTSVELLVCFQTTSPSKKKPLWHTSQTKGL